MEHRGELGYKGREKEKDLVRGIPPLSGRKYLQVNLQIKNASNTSSNLDVFRRAYLKDNLDHHLFWNQVRILEEKR